MKKAICILVLVLFCWGLVYAQVNGDLRHMGDRYILQVWGTHYERGYAQGYLMGEQIMNVFKYYFYTNVCGSNASTYNYYQQYHLTHYLTDPRYESELSGIIAGMTDAGADLYHSGLGRNLHVHDLLYVNAIVDINAGSKDAEWGCSSLSSWGSSTADDPELQGALQITRLLDWTRNNTLVANPVLVVHHPSEPDERKWMSFTYPGLIGALSGISENRAAAFLNMGNVHTLVNEDELSSVLLDVRSGLERLDFNLDNVHDTGDIFSSLSQGNHKNGTIIHAVQQWQDSLQTVVIETNNTGTVKRRLGDESALNGDNLAATNHFRLLADPVYCLRYNKITDSLSVNTDVDIQRSWDLMRGAGGVSHNMMMIQYVPSLDKAYWAIATTMAAAYQREPIELDLMSLFNFGVSNYEDSISPAISRMELFPNPLRSGTKLQTRANEGVVSVYNLRGQLLYKGELSRLDNSSVFSARGIYLLRGESSTAKLIYLD